MKLLALLVLVLPSGLLTLVTNTPPSPAPLQENRYNEFTTKFKTALANSAHEELAKLVRQYQEQALMHVDYLSARVIEGSNAEVEKEFEGLRRAWKAAFNNGFVDKMYEFASLLTLDPPKRVERVKALKQFNAVVERLDKTRTTSPGSPEFDVHAEEFRALAQVFTDVGDRYFAGRAWNGFGICHMEENRKKDADFQKVFDAFGKAIEHWDAVEFRGPLYISTRDYYERLKVEKFSGGVPDPNAPPPPEAMAASAPVTVALAFEPLPELEKIERPNYHHDDLYQIWPMLQLQDVGSESELSSARGLSPKIKRVSAAKIAVDGDRDGTPEVEVPITGNQTLVRTRIGAGEEVRDWAFLFTTGIEQDTFQGLKVNLGSGKDYMSLFCAGAASLTGSVGATPVRVIDDNVDGIYGSQPLLWNYIGLVKESLQPDIDAIVVGDAKRARPWSELQEIGGAWYKLEVEPGGKSLLATPMTLETGTLRLDAKGVKPDWVVLRGKGKLEKCFFDISADPKKGVAVPVGEYELSFGILREGKKQQTMKALMLPGQQTRTWTVGKGQEAVVELGAPYSISFDTSVEGDKLTVVGSSVTVRGSAGERYERIYNAVLRPEVSFRKKGTKRGGKPERMPVVLDMDELNEQGQRKHSFADVWRPLDLVLTVPAGEAVEVQLVEKKNKLFGNLESEWK